MTQGSGEGGDPDDGSVAWCMDPAAEFLTGRRRNKRREEEETDMWPHCHVLVPVSVFKTAGGLNMNGFG